MNPKYRAEIEICFISEVIAILSIVNLSIYL